MNDALRILAGAGLLAAGLSGAFAQSGSDVIKSKCAVCHEFDKKKVGPAFKDVAAKYKGDPAAETMLINKIKEGKTHPRIPVSDAELKAAVGQVLSTK